VLIPDSVYSTRFGSPGMGAKPARLNDKTLFRVSSETRSVSDGRSKSPGVPRFRGKAIFNSALASNAGS
jgi:hypothetical protein